MAALHGHAWTRRALEAMASFSPSEGDEGDEEAEWAPPIPTPTEGSAADPTEFVKPVKKALQEPPVAFRVRLRVAGGRELVWDAGEIEGLELEGPHVVELGAC